MTSGPQKKTFEFGSFALNASTLFRSYEGIASREFISYLNALKRKYGKFVLLCDGVPWQISEKVERFLKKNRRKIKPVMFPTFSPELNPADERWDLEKEGLLGSTVQENFDKMKKGVSEISRNNDLPH